MGVYTAMPSNQDTLKYIIPNVFYGIFALIYLIKYKFTAKVI